jgi:hypothetical protein
MGPVGNAKTMEKHHGKPSKPRPSHFPAGQRSPSSVGRSALQIKKVNLLQLVRQFVSEMFQHSPQSRAKSGLLRPWTALAATAAR